MKDYDAQAFVFQRLQRIKLGNFGDCKPVDNGLWELRIHSKSGLRVYYYARVGRQVILIIGGADKGSQRHDISQAKEYLKEYKRRMQ